MTKRRWMVLLVGVIALGMVAHIVAAEDEGERPRRGRPDFRRPRPDGEGRGKPDGEGRGKPGGEGRGKPGGEGDRRPMMRRPMMMMSPLMVALDANKDGKLDKAEIAKATEVLTKLAGEDGVLTREELRPKRPMGRGRPGGEGEGPRKGAGEGRGKPGGEDGEHPGRGRGPGRGGRGRGSGEGGRGRGSGEGGRGRGPIDRPE